MLFFAGLQQQLVWDRPCQRQWLTDENVISADRSAGVARHLMLCAAAVASISIQFRE
jgi:hypothetical protein